MCVCVEGLLDRQSVPYIPVLTWHSQLEYCKKLVFLCGKRIPSLCQTQVTLSAPKEYGYWQEVETWCLHTLPLSVSYSDYTHWTGVLIWQLQKSFKPGEFLTLKQVRTYYGIRKRLKNLSSLLEWRTKQRPVTSILTGKVIDSSTTGVQGQARPSQFAC